MHELSLAQAVVDAVAERVAGARVTGVRLEIGRLSGVVTDSIRFCFGLVAEGTALEGAALDIDEPPGRGECRTCGTEFAVDDPIVLCPSCGGANVHVLSGRQLLIVSVRTRAETEGSRACAPPADVPARST